MHPDKFISITKLRGASLRNSGELYTEFCYMLGAFYAFFLLLSTVHNVLW